MAKKAMKKEAVYSCSCDMKVYGIALVLLGVLKYFNISWEFSLMITGAFLIFKSLLLK